MQVVYEPSIVDRLRQVRHTAALERRIVRKVVLTKDEMDDLFTHCAFFKPPRTVPRSVTFLGMLVEQEPDDAAN